MNQQDLERLYQLRFGAFSRVAAAIAGDDERGADAVQDAFANAVRSLESFRGDAPLEAWVWGIVLNSARAIRRKAQETPVPELDPEQVGSPEELSGQVSAVREAVARLPERERLVVFLRYFADLDYRSIGEVLDIHTGTVSAALHAAHAELRGALEEVRT